MSSPVLIWPDAAQVHEAIRAWARRAARARPDVRRIGYFGSYARGDWGPGSDVDLVVIVASSDTRAPRRALDWDATELPVPADLVVLTEMEWQALDPTSRFGRVLRQETVWVLEAGAPAS